MLFKQKSSKVYNEEHKKSIKRLAMRSKIIQTYFSNVQMNIISLHNVKETWTYTHNLSWSRMQRDNMSVLRIYTSVVFLLHDCFPRKHLFLSKALGVEDGGCFDPTDPSVQKSIFGSFMNFHFFDYNIFWEKEVREFFLSKIWKNFFTSM